MTQTLKRVRLIDVAKKAGVSVTTVGYVLAGSGGSNVSVGAETAERVRKVAEGLNYQPNLVARQLTGKPSNLIAVMFDPDVSPTNINLFLELERQAQKYGYKLLVGNPTHDVQQITSYVDELLSRSVDGLICFKHNLPNDPEGIPQYTARIKHAVFIRRPAFGNAPYVEVDETAGTQVLMDHLRAQGRRRPAIAISDLRWAGVRERERAFREYWRACKFEGEPLVWIAGERVKGDPQRLTSDAADDAIKDMVLAQQADAIICQTDYWAATLIRQLKRHNIAVPDRVAVVGYDNLDIAPLIDPALTTLDPQVPKIAEAAMQILIESINGKTDPDIRRSMVVRPRLIVRESS
jgi:DNA-binding LacI/PurR family transcriptional regulator